MSRVQFTDFSRCELHEDCRAHEELGRQCAERRRRGVKRTHAIHFSLTDQEVLELKDAQERAGLTMADLMRFVVRRLHLDARIEQQELARKRAAIAKKAGEDQ